MIELLEESEVQTLIQTNKFVQDGIKNALGIDKNKELQFIREDQYINGITADFTVLDDKKIVAIIECKSGKINVTDYVRGIGQLLQYEYFFTEKIPHKDFTYTDSFKTIYFFPSSVIKNNNFNISKFKYPNTTNIFELNEVNNAVRKITDKELKNLKTIDNNLIAISQYYFRDNRIFEYYILLKYLYIQGEKNISKIDRKKTEQELKKINTINNGNWRNSFITLSNLGLINHKNLLTKVGKELVICDYEEFAVKMYHSYLEPYFKEIYNCFNDKGELSGNNIEIGNIIRKNHNNKDILYLTQSRGRYISSWLNIMRDDYGILSFESRKKLKKINYNFTELTDNALEKKIKEYSIAYEYIDRYIKLLNKEEL